jgi:hypothetical protein
MRRAYFDTYWGSGWPDTAWLEPYFLAPANKRWSFEDGNDGGSLTLEGANGTEHLGTGAGRIDTHLMMTGNPRHGVMLHYFQMGIGTGPNCYSRGDLNRLYDREQTIHGDILPLGLCIPFETAWQAVKEFIERDGALPQSIEWIASRDLPKNVFPEE